MNSVTRKNITITLLNHSINPKMQQLSKVTSHHNLCVQVHKELDICNIKFGQKQGKLDINEVQRVEIMGLKQLQQPFYNTNNFKELKLYSYKLVYTKMKTTYYDVRGI